MSVVTLTSHTQCNNDRTQAVLFILGDDVGYGCCYTDIAYTV